MPFAERMTEVAAAGERIVCLDGVKKEDRSCAQLCTGVLVKDWGQDPLARCAYSHPSLHALGSREVRARRGVGH